MTRLTGARAAAVVLTAFVAACATAGRLRIPEGPSRPVEASDVAAPLGQATGMCRDVTTMTAEIGLSGRVGTLRMRGRVLAGFQRPGSLRLEAPAPFGAPVFVLAASADRAVILFPRDRRVLRDAAVADVIEALIGLRRNADDLLALLSGCLASGLEPEPGGSRRFDSGWMTVAFSGGVEGFLRSQRRRWQMAGGRTPVEGDREAPPWAIAYDQFAAGFPGRVRVSRPSMADMTFRVSQVEVNRPIDPAAFTLRIPPSAESISLDDLRRMGPLADRTEWQEGR